MYCGYPNLFFYGCHLDECIKICNAGALTEEDIECEVKKNVSSLSFPTDLITILKVLHSSIDECYEVQGHHTIL